MDNNYPESHRAYQYWRVSDPQFWEVQYLRTLGGTSCWTAQIGRFHNKMCAPSQLQFCFFFWKPVLKVTTSGTHWSFSNLKVLKLPNKNWPNRTQKSWNDACTSSRSIGSTQETLETERSAGDEGEKSCFCRRWRRNMEKHSAFWLVFQVSFSLRQFWHMSNMLAKCKRNMDRESTGCSAAHHQAVHYECRCFHVKSVFTSDRIHFVQVRPISWCMFPKNNPCNDPFGYHPGNILWFSHEMNSFHQFPTDNFSASHVCLPYHHTGYPL